MKRKASGKTSENDIVRSSEQSERKSKKLDPCSPRCKRAAHMVQWG